MSANTATVRRYLTALSSGDLEGMTGCCTTDAVVVSPVYGTVPARSFFEKLHADTISAEVKIRSIYVAEDGDDRIIAHFSYRWERRSAPTLDTYVLDLFELTPDAQIKRIRIILDDEASAAA